MRKIVSTNTNITDMRYMFYNSLILDLDLSEFNTTNVTNMSFMFRKSDIFSLNLKNFNTEKVVNMSFMFEGAVVREPLDLSSFKTTEVMNNHKNPFSGMFTFGSFESLDLRNFDFTLGSEWGKPILFLESSIGTIYVGTQDDFDIANYSKPRLTVIEIVGRS